MAHAVILSLSVVYRSWLIHDWRRGQCLERNPRWIDAAMKHQFDTFFLVWFGVLAFLFSDIGETRADAILNLECRTMVIPHVLHCGMIEFYQPLISSFIWRLWVAIATNGILFITPTRANSLIFLNRNFKKQVKVSCYFIFAEFQSITAQNVGSQDNTASKTNR